jgi:shikimate kinase
VVWLNVPLDALAKRVTAVGTESRPLLPPDAAQHQAFARLSKLLEQRGAAYSHADATVSIQVLAEELGIEDYSEITPTMIALQVLEEIDKLLIEKECKMPKVHY